MLQLKNAEAKAATIAAENEVDMKLAAAVWYEWGGPQMLWLLEILRQ